MTVDEFNSRGEKYYGGDEDFPAGCVAIASYENYEDYSSDYVVIAQNDEGYWVGEGGGCSCGDSTSVNGPFATEEEAISSISHNRADDELVRHDN